MRETYYLDHKGSKPQVYPREKVIQLIINSFDMTVPPSFPLEKEKYLYCCYYKNKTLTTTYAYTLTMFDMSGLWPTYTHTCLV